MRTYYLSRNVHTIDFAVGSMFNDFKDLHLPSPVRLLRGQVMADTQKCNFCVVSVSELFPVDYALLKAK